MALINRAAGVVDFKLVYYGPGEAGKTSNLLWVHRALADATKGSLVSVATGDERTYFFDFLPVRAPRIGGLATKFHLFTVPGQDQFNTTRKVLLRAVDGIVFVADSRWDRVRHTVESLRNLESNLRACNDELDRIPLVLQYNKRDLPATVPLDYLEYLLNHGPRRVPSFPAVATTGVGVFETLNAIARMVLLAELGPEVGTVHRAAVSA